MTKFATSVLMIALMAAILGYAALPTRAVAPKSPAASAAAACAKVCAECQLQCDMCFAHCRDQLADGKREHDAASRLCVDCADCCRLAATLTARGGPLCVEAGEFCARCCDKCAAECDKLPNDPRMAGCAKACRDCAAACRTMMQESGAK